MGRSQSASQINYAGGYAGWTEWNAQALMLPYMEQGPIYNAINFSFCSGYSYGAQANASASTRLIASFMCPSDTNVGFGGAPVSNQSTISGWGQSTYPPNTNSYKGSIGTTTSTWGWTTGYSQCQPDPFNLSGGPNPCSPYSTGLFVYFVSNSITNVTDGTSNTIAYSESLVGDGNNPVPTHRNNSVTGASSLSSVLVPDASALITRRSLYPH